MSKTSVPDEKTNDSGTNQPTVSTGEFIEDFSGNYVLEETGGISEKSKNSDWWLNSGAYLYFNDGYAGTVQGSLPSDDKWRIKYDQTKPGETDNGYHPQNIFRLVLRSKWGDLRQQVYFKINEYYLSSDENRSASNGLLLFNRYQDGDNLYYVGVRVDGTAVIKKKCESKYYTMAQNQVFGNGGYDRDNNPNLLPENIWIGVMSEVTNNGGVVNIKAYIDEGKTGNWRLAAEADDSENKYWGSPFLSEGYAGIRTDFMDAEFMDYRIKSTSI